MSKRVVVAMSGGVDSSVAAALLKSQGYDVIGITMQIWPDLDPELEVDFGGCCSLQAANDARAVAGKLGIPFYVVNFKAKFEEHVIQYFCKEYMLGRTPNPCLVCNFKVKFEDLLAKALELDASYLATGHYARVEYDSSRDRFLLRRGVDRSKDQSYVLYGLKQWQLQHAIFPLGHYTKAQARKVARSFGLNVAEKPESQEICFVVNGTYRDFIKARFPDAGRPGPIVSTKGELLGTHSGIHNYTIGQRRGLGLNLGEKAYVVALDPDTNTVVVGNETDLYSRSLVAKEVNFIPFDSLTEPIRVTAKVRYRGPEVPATVLPAGDNAVTVNFMEPQRAITPGQAVVFYDGDLVVGGGIIN